MQEGRLEKLKKLAEIIVRDLGDKLADARVEGLLDGKDEGLLAGMDEEKYEWKELLTPILAVAIDKPVKLKAILGLAAEEEDRHGRILEVLFDVPGPSAVTIVVTPVAMLSRLFDVYVESQLGAFWNCFTVAAERHGDPEFAPLLDVVEFYEIEEAADAKNHNELPPWTTVLLKAYVANKMAVAKEVSSRNREYQ